METFLWVEKYRPRSISECILPKDLKDTFSEFVKDKHIPNLILCGSAGVGKTTVAKAMLDEIGEVDQIIYVASNELLKGNWERCYNLILKLKLWKTITNPE